MRDHLRAAFAEARGFLLAEGVSRLEVLQHNARGDLTFSLKTVPPNFGRGPYSGTIQLEQEPPK